MTEQKRRIEDQLPDEPLQWDGEPDPRADEIRVERQQALLNCAAALLKAERAQSAAVAFPGTTPEQYVMIGTADDILRLLPLPGATDGLLRATIREVTTLLIERQDIDHLMNDPDLVRLLSALTTMAVNSAARFAAPQAVAGKGEVPSPGAAEDARDAARYRWLVRRFGVTALPCFLERDFQKGYIADGKESIDAAIDAAMGAFLSSPAERQEAEADIPISMSTFGTMDACNAERERRAHLATPSSPSVSGTVDTNKFQSLVGDWALLAWGEHEYEKAEVIWKEVIAHIDQHTAQAVGAAREEARNAALEEAASVYMVGNVAAREIRKLKTQPAAPQPAEGQEEP